MPTGGVPGGLWQEPAGWAHLAASQGPPSQFRKRKPVIAQGRQVAPFKTLGGFPASWQEGISRVRLFVTPWTGALWLHCPWGSPGKNT